MKELLLATANPAKIAELTGAFAPLTEKGIHLVTVKDLGLEQEPEETGKTFEENAVLKARYYGRLSGLPCVADDGGLVIDVLDPEPGVKSKRWLGYDASDEEIINYTLNKLKSYPPEKRAARLELCLCFFHPDKDVILTDTQAIRGYIAEKPTGSRILGFPYRALMKVYPFDKYYDELTHEEHEQVNHRRRAARSLIGKILPYLLE